jgi:hypothetical protein
VEKRGSSKANYTILSILKRIAQFLGNAFFSVEDGEIFSRVTTPERRTAAHSSCGAKFSGKK